MYNILIRPFTRRMKPEKANRLAMRYFKAIGKIPGMRFFSRILHNNAPGVYSREVFGMQFYNPLGLGAGLDLRGELYNDLNDLGFSFTEIGPLDENSVREAISNIQKDPQDDILAACISSDFLTVFSLAYDFCDFFVIDVSAQESIDTDEFHPLLDARLTYDTYKPLVVKVPDRMSECDLRELLNFCLMNGIDGVIARNFSQIRIINEFSGGRMPVIANCHTRTVSNAVELLKAGASLVEVRSGLVTEGPSLVAKILKQLSKCPI